MHLTRKDGGFLLIGVATILACLSVGDAITGNAVGAVGDAGTGALLVVICLIAGLLLLSGNGPLDAIIIPTQASEERDRQKARAAAALYRSGATRKLIPSGGKTPGLDPNYSSGARVIAEELLKEGIPAEDIILEERAQNNVDNLLYSIPKAGGPEIGILSYPSHLDRFETIYDRGKAEGVFPGTTHLHRLEMDERMIERLYERAARTLTGRRIANGVAASQDLPQPRIKRAVNGVMKALTRR